MGKSHLCAFIVLGILALVSFASAELPSTVDAIVTGPGTDSYVDVTILAGGNGELTPGLHQGWYNAPVEMLGEEQHTFSVYSSLDTNPTSISAKNWNKINYILKTRMVPTQPRSRRQSHFMMARKAHGPMRPSTRKNSLN